jgi:hypothetical protein
MKRWIAIVMSFLPLVASAAGFWDGNAALQRGDSSFESGLFAVSDSFAPDTVILVENLDTGKTARVTVSQGAPSQANILVLLSPLAADALGIATGTVARVRVTLAARAPSNLASLDQDRVSSADPEINPAVAQAAQQPDEAPAEVETAPVETAPVETAPVEAATTVEPTQPSEPATEQLAAVPAEPAVTPPSVPETPAEVAPAQAESAELAAEPGPSETAPMTEDEQLLQELAARNPQKQLFLPPREDEKFAYQEAVEPPAAQVATAAESTPAPQGAAPAPEIAAAAPAAEPSGSAQPQELPSVPLVVEQPGVVPLGIESVAAAAEPSPPEPGAGLAAAEVPGESVPDVSDQVAAAVPESLAVARLPMPEAAPTAQQPAQPAAPAAPTAQPAPVPLVVEAAPASPTAEPIAALPPAAAPKAPAAPKPQPVPAAPPVVEQKAPPVKAEQVPAPPAGTPYYVQLAAYATESLASGLASSLAATYPVLVLTPAAGARQVYRVLVGPLNRAESGTLLRWFRNRGFPDAFVKQQ